MRLERASSKAIKYAVMNWHYSKSLPAQMMSFSVFEGREWCGVICYGIGANKNINKPFSLASGEVIELLRVALNGKQSSTSKAVSLSLKLLRSFAPLVRLIVSYADEAQGHKGIIYQATNWYFVGDSVSCVPVLNSKQIHKRTFSSVHGSYAGKSMIKQPPKHKYIYPLDKSLIPLCKSLAKPYPKKQAQEVLPVARLAPSQEEGFDSTPALKLQK